MKTLLAICVATLMLGACAPPSPPPSPPPVPKRYVDMVFPAASVTVGITYASGRPDLVTGDPVDLHLDVSAPTKDTVTNRPAILWIHGGGFRVGSRAGLDSVATEYSRRGYVSIPVDYRLDPGNRCQDVQDGKIRPEQLEAETARCLAAIDAAQADTATAVAWVRSHAAQLGIDPDRIVAAGFSAGAVTATHLGERQNGAGGPVDPTTRVSAVLAASGCNYELDTIDASDAPISMLASQFDQAVPFGCSTAVVDRSTALGIHTQGLFHLGEGTHAMDLYTEYKTQTDAAWTGFLVRELHL